MSANILRKSGKKTKEWLSDRKIVIRGALASGRIEIVSGVTTGRCEECREWKPLDLDHIVSRGRGGDNKASNIQFLCRDCHIKKHNMPKKKAKGNWKEKHICIQCKKWTRFILCEHCSKISLKM